MTHGLASSTVNGLGILACWFVPAVPLFRVAENMILKIIYNHFINNTITYLQASTGKYLGIPYY